MYFAALSRAVDAQAMRGGEVRLRGKPRAARHGKARLWLRVDIPPTIPAARTIAGVAAGRDEVLERGLAHVRAPAPKTP